MISGFYLIRGYDPVFAEVGERFGTIDFALMECGQYNVDWQSVHKLPQEVRQATLDIKARRMLPCTSLQVYSG